MQHDHGLSARQQAILQHIYTYLERNQAPPTAREIMRSFGLDSLSGVIYDLAVLTRAGLIERGPAPSTGVRLTFAGLEIARGLPQGA